MKWTMDEIYLCPASRKLKAKEFLLISYHDIVLLIYSSPSSSLIPLFTNLHYIVHYYYQYQILFQIKLAFIEHLHSGNNLPTVSLCFICSVGLIFPLQLVSLTSPYPEPSVHIFLGTAALSED